MKNLNDAEYRQYDAADFAMEDSFIQWVLHGDPACEKFWTAWAAANPARADELALGRSLVLAMQFREKDVTNERVNAAMEQLHQRLLRNRSAVPGKPKSRTFAFRRLMRVAAALLLIAVPLFSAWWLYYGQVAPGETASRALVKETLPGQTFSLALADGTLVKLNAGSRIEYPETFTGNTREVTLAGEAFFMVAHDAEKPFKVHTGDITTEVLGTTFNVNAYPDNTAIHIALVSGQVMVKKKSTGAAASRDTLLAPRQMIAITGGTDRWQITPFNVEEITGWKDGYLYFEKATFAEVRTRLQRWYGVTINMDDHANLDPAWRFSGRFKDRSLDYILRAMSYPDFFRYTEENGTVTIY